MSTDLREALHEAVADAPFDASDLRTAVAVGSRRVRRRAAIRVGSAALAVAAVVLTSVVVGSDRSDHEPLPADVVHLDLSRAATQDLDILASVRTTWREPMDDLDHDRFEGLTTDGLVLRSRYISDGSVYQLGLLDPETGETDWLPPSPVATETDGVELTADRLVLFAQLGPRRGFLLMFDRRSQTWESTDLRLPGGLEAHVPFRLALGLDGRLYLGSTYENDPRPLSWWSYPVPQGGDGQPEPALTGADVAWGDGLQASADSEGRVILTSSAGERLVAEERPTGCETPTDPAYARWPATVGLAGSRPVVTYWCGDGRDEWEPMTLVYEADGDGAIQVARASFQAAHEQHVLLAPSRGERAGLYLLDLDRLTITRIGPGIHEAQVGLADGLALWNEPGPIDDNDVYDVVWKVARLPLDD